MSDPTRLLDDLDADDNTRALLEQFEQLEPPAGAEQLIREKILAHIASGAVGGTGGAVGGGGTVTGAVKAVSTKTGWGLLPKVLVAAAVTGSGGLVSVSILRGAKETGSSARTIQANAPTPGSVDDRLPSTGPGPDERTSPNFNQGSGHPLGERDAVPQAVGSSRDEERNQDRDRSEEGVRKKKNKRSGPNRAKSRTAEESEVSETSDRSTGPAAGAVGAGSSVTRWSVDPPEPASQTTETKLAEEVKLLERAQRALAQHQPAVAQSLTREADAKFGNSQLRLEREAISILAAWQAGEKTDAIARAKLFIRRFPASPHAAKLKEIAEAKP